jgi:alpha 1,2-mannosyltransferase
MPASPSIRTTRLVLLLFFAVASLYYISRSYARIPFPPTADSFIPGGREPTKEPAAYPQHDAAEENVAIEIPELTGGKPRQVGKTRAAFVTLVRNNELWEIVKSIRQIEDRFNRKYHYPWIFLNDVPFTQEFKDIVDGLISGEVKFGTEVRHLHLFVLGCLWLTGGRSGSA